MSENENEHNGGLGDQGIQPQYIRVMHAIARVVDETLNGYTYNTPKVLRPQKTTGFILLVFPFGHRGRCNYISTADRDDVIKLLEDQLKHFKAEKAKDKRGKPKS